MAAGGMLPAVIPSCIRFLAHNWLGSGCPRTCHHTLWTRFQPERLPDLLVLELELDNIADLARTIGLEEVGLPSTYPVGYTTTSAWTVTQTVGATIHDAGHTSILTRSATATQWTGQVETWAEIAIFTDQAPKPTLTERIPYGDWL